ncbi:MAG: hypothetical protein AABX01_01460 [Candidatus Micrarchaeota archaeon]
MAKSKVNIGLPKIEGFERVKYHGLADYGLSARVYSAYFGRPKRILDAFNILYCRGREKTPSTGRISLISKQLVDANYLDLYKIERSNWPLMASNLNPLYEKFQLAKVRLNDADRGMLEKALIGDYEASLRFGISDDEAQGKEEFIPSTTKMQRHLNSVATLALLSLARQQQPDFKEERELLRRIKAKTYGASQKALDGAGELQGEDIISIEGFAGSLALSTRVEMKEGEEPSNMLLFKIIRLMHMQKEAQAIEGAIVALFE